MLSPRQRFLVSGRLSQPNGSTLVGAIAKAFDKDLPSRQPNEKELGQATTDAEGRYEITYTVTQLSRNEKGSADLIVRVFNQEGTQLAESPIHFNAPAETTVDLVVVPLQEAQRSESEQLLTKINPILDGVKLANVTDEDITFLLGATDIERERIEFLRKAAQLAQETDLLTTQKTDLPTVFFYGLARQNLPLSREGLFDLPPETLRQALESAIETNIIPARLRDSLDDFTKRFNQSPPIISCSLKRKASRMKLAKRNTCRPIHQIHRVEYFSTLNNSKDSANSKISSAHIAIRRVDSVHYC